MSESSGSVVLVCGGRDFFDEPLVSEILDAEHIDRPISKLVHGDARGADTLAKKWALARSVSQTAYAADWRRHGRAAGPIRNQMMLDIERPRLVIAFPGGRGTADMVKRAKACRVPVLDVEDLLRKTSERLTAKVVP